MIGITINTVSAEKFVASCYGGEENHNANWTKKFLQKVDIGELVKKNGEYYKKIYYLYEFEQQACYHSSHKNDWSQVNGYSRLIQSIADPRGDKFSKFDLVKVKKGDVISKTEPKYWKTTQSNGKIHKVYKFSKKVAVNSKTLKTVTATSKKLVAYYKTFKMPTFKPGNYKWGYFKGNYFTYGNSYIGYYVNHLNDYEYYNPYNRVYKMTPKSTNLLGANMFSKKPSSFTLYAYA